MNKTEILDQIRKYAEDKLKPKEFIPGETYIPPSSPSLNDDDVATICDAALNFWYTEHKYCAKFSRALEKYLDKKHCVLCNSGSSASLLALTALINRTKKRYPKRKYVLTTALGFPTTVAPIYQNGFIPIYIDVDITSLQPDIDQVFYFIKQNSEEIAGVVFAHTLGFQYDEMEINNVLPNDVWLISDCCDAIGAKGIGQYSDAITLSFFPAHQIFSGEGGAVLVDDIDLAEDIRSLNNWGRDCYCLPGQHNVCGCRFEVEAMGIYDLPEGWDHKYTFTSIGYNLKMTELQAALGWSQLNRVEDFITKRRDNYNKLWRANINKADVHSIYCNMCSPFGYPIYYDGDVPEFISYLEEAKIGTRRVFGGNLTRQPAYKNLPYLHKDLSVTDLVMNNMFWIGCHPSLTEEMLDYMIDTINTYLERN